MSDRKRTLEERLKSSPILYNRISAVLDIVENVDGQCETADEAEQKAIEELRKLGNDVLHGWADNQHSRRTAEIKATSNNIKGNGKKNSFG